MRKTNHPHQTSGQPGQEATHSYAIAIQQDLDRIVPGANFFGTGLTKLALRQTERELEKIQSTLADELVGVPTGRGNESHWNPVISRVVEQFVIQRKKDVARIERALRFIPVPAPYWASSNKRAKDIERIYQNHAAGTLDLTNLFGAKPTDAALASKEQLRRWIAGRIRKAVIQYREAITLVVGMVGSHRKQSVYCSRQAKVERRAQKEAQQAFLEATTVTNQQTGESIRLVDIVGDAAHRKISKWHVISLGMQDMAKQLGHEPMFITLTAPPEYHPSPSKGKTGNYNGATPKETQQWFVDQFEEYRALESKHGIDSMYIRTVEPHKDGCPHWHMMLWARPEHHELIKKFFRRKFGHSRKAVEIRSFNNGGEAEAATYMLKYIKKALDPRIEDPIDAWSSAWNIRSIQTGGLPAGALTSWDLARRVDPETAHVPSIFTPAIKAARDNDFAGFCSALRSAEIRPLVDTQMIAGDEPGTFYSSKRYIGLVSESTGELIKTKTVCWVIHTDIGKFRKTLEANRTQSASVTVSANYPRAAAPPEGGFPA